jgi:DNA (cytosine-5)-methyltransferase 1
MTQQTNADSNFTHLGLFEGIGGFSLAARWMGWQTLAWCEWNKFGQKVLKHHFPNAEGFGDITKTDFTKYANRIDILTGGFPCQPYSLAGKRKGKEDDRHLWPEMCRAIREIQPTWVVGENVFGLVNWDGGLVFNEVQADLEAQGYEVFPYVLPAVSVNAPHRRDRVWFVAYRNKCAAGPSRKSGGVESNGSKNNDEQKLWGEQTQLNTGSHELLRDATHPNSNGQHWCDCEHEVNASKRGINAQRDVEQMGKHNATDTNDKRLERKCRAIGKLERGFRLTMPDSSNNKPNNWQNFPTQSPICSGDDGLSTRLDSITFPKWRNESIKAAGNAIVPQVAHQIFKAIQQHHDTTRATKTL